MTRDSKIITSLEARRAIESAIAGLADVANEQELIEKAHHIAEMGQGVLPAVLRHLNTRNPQLRGGLGRIAAALPEETIAPALRAVAADRSRSDQERLTALLILERFLHQNLDDSLFADLRNPHAVAQDSLHEVTELARTNRHVLLEYLDQLAQEPPETAFIILNTLERLPEEDQVELLRLMAQDPNTELAQRALSQLGKLRVAAAGDALYTLRQMLPHDLAQQADRHLRKWRLQQGFTTAPPAPSPNWRALLSPVDGAGTQTIQFIYQEEGAGTASILSLLIHDERGILHAFGDEEAPAADLPRRQSVGHIHQIVSPTQGAVLTLLEVSFDHARQHAREALPQNWATDTPTPPTYRLYNPWLWRWQPPSPDAVSPSTAEDAEPIADLDKAAELVMQHPAFANWLLVGERVEALARRLNLESSEEKVVASIEKLVQEHVDQAQKTRYMRRLQANAAWLQAAGAAREAAAARALSKTLPGTMPQGHPFFLRLAALSLAVAWHSLQRRSGPSSV